MGATLAALPRERIGGCPKSMPIGLRAEAALLRRGGAQLGLRLGDALARSTLLPRALRLLQRLLRRGDLARGQRPRGARPPARRRLRARAADRAGRERS